MAPHVHSFSMRENKVNRLTEWLKGWIKASLKSGKIKPGDLLPAKGEIACHIGVSQGTMQNVFRALEDAGFVESKQRIGTYIKNPTQKKHAEKLTSKRELAIETIKKILTENNYKIGESIPSTRKLAKLTNIADTTVRLAVNNLVSEGVLAKKDNSFTVKSLNFSVKEISAQTLVEKVAESLKKYIKQEFSAGEKLPANSVLMKKFNVSIKTIHDALKLLSKEGFVYTRRGQYGTVVTSDSSALYNYEKVEQKIRNYILNNSKIGDKLPTIKEFSQMLNTSGKTVKKALDNLAEDGYLMFTRGRYGGTFVTDLPQAGEDAYKWLAINSDYVQN